MFSNRALLFLLPCLLQVAPSLQQDEACATTYLNELELAPNLITYRYTINIDSLDSTQSTIMFQYQYNASDVWIGFGLAQAPEAMIGGEVVIGIPESETSSSSVMKYKLGGYGLADVQMLPESQQTLMDTSMEVTEEGLTLMSFTKFLEEEGEFSWNGNGGNDIIGALGMSNVLAAHAPDRRGGFNLALTPDCVDGVLVAKATPEAPAVAPVEVAPPIPLDEACATTYLNELVLAPNLITYRYTINIDSMDSAQSTVMFQYQYNASDVWIGFGLAQTPEAMFGGEVVIGIPESDDSSSSVMKFKLGGYGLADVQPLPESQQTLMDTSMEVTDEGLTLMSFTKFLEEEGELSWNGNGGNDIIGALGMSNVLAAHAPDRRGGFNLAFTPDCVDGVLVEKTIPEAPAVAPVEVAPPIQLDEACATTYLNELELIPNLITYRYTVNIDSMDATQSTIMFQYQYNVSDVWIGFGLAQTPEAMIGAEVVIGIPESEDSGSSVMKYTIGGYALSDVQPLPESQQTLIDMSMEVTEEGLTLMSFTKFLEEDGELSWNGNGGNDIIGALGMSNLLAAHAPDRRGGFNLVLTPDCVDGVLVEKEAPESSAPAAAPAKTTDDESNATVRAIENIAMAVAFLAVGGVLLVGFFDLNAKKPSGVTSLGEKIEHAEGEPTANPRGEGEDEDSSYSQYA